MNFTQQKTRTFLAVLLCCGLVVQAEDWVRVTRNTDIKVGAEAVGKAMKGDKFIKIREHGAWVGIRFEKDGKQTSGWVLKSAVADAAEGAATIEAVVEAVTEVVVDVDVVVDTSKMTGALVKAKGAMLLGRVKGINHVMKQVQALMFNVQPMLAAVVSLDALLMNIPEAQRARVKEGFNLDSPMAFVVYQGKKQEGGTSEPEVCFVVPVKSADVAAEFIQSQPGAPKYKTTDKYLWLSDKEDVIARAVNDFGTVQGIPVEDMKGEVHLTVFLQSAMEQVVGEIEKQLKNAQANAEGAAESKARLEAMGQEFGLGLVKSMQKELSELSYEIAVSGTGVRLANVLSFKAGSETGKVVRKIATASAPDISGLVPSQDAVFLGSLQTSGPELTGLCGNFIDEMFRMAVDSGELKGAEKEAANQLKKTVISVLNSCHGNLAISVVPAGDEAAFVAAIGTKDDLSGKLESLIDQAEKQAKEQAGEVVLETVRKEREHQGVAIKTFIEKTKDGKKESEVELASLSNVALVVAGKSVAEVTNAAIGQVQAGGGTPAELVSAGKNFQGRRIGTFSMTIMKIIALVDKSASGLAQQDVPISSAILVRGDKLVSEVLIPVKPIQLLQGYIMQKLMKPKQEDPDAGPQGL